MKQKKITSSNQGSQEKLSTKVNSQEISTQQQISSKLGTDPKLNKPGLKLSQMQLTEEILQGLLLADTTELIKLRLKDQAYLKKLNSKKI